ncbi:B3 domain-containing transcription repressor VAL2 [Heracleum sosnowskyi]|uniref:B3 domain-containing transcription repressor VAL2 n=1 Tax=Heracleum sosnowskyi TaxID=360622 RepID=A0AAD8MP29_9APIA|nr:B3 domain-containing transcription repressor VAL2 [Heracleum sosnowskyi]
MASSSSSLPKLCFNSSCNQLLGEHSRRGWRRRTGEFADLCDRCAIAFEEGKFCESFHLNASGWRSCESCGKQIHCGCIVSFHMFVLLDAGGIECITCTKKSFILTPNPAWPPPSLLLPGLPERIKDLSVKNWSSIAATGPVPWRQAPSLFNPELHPKMPLEFNMPTGIDKLLGSKKLSDSSVDKKENLVYSGKLINGSLKGGTSHMLENGTSGSKCEEQQSPYVNDDLHGAMLKNEPFSPHPDLTPNPASKIEIAEQSSISVSHALPPAPPPAASNYSGVDSSGEGHAHNGRPRDRNQLLPRYWPKISDEELQQISEDSNSVITPLFEKVLTASDAGKIGRLVLPKKCAEVYLPPISNPEGIPLPVQDLKGEEWVFQFRFWPNNNSRMYVLEGVSPCIQSMQLRAGDTITFNRLNPHGKLVMGCRKASSASNQKKEPAKSARDKPSARGDAIAKKNKSGEFGTPQHYSNKNSVSSSLLEVNKVNLADSARKCYKVVENKCDAKVKPAAKPDFGIKRKNSILGSKSKRLRIETEDMIELNLTWEQAQGLFHPPPNDVPKIVVIDGYEIEEFEEPPIIGRPTIVATNNAGEIIQWVQCEDCFKWRKVPGYAIFPSRWTCFENLWDPKRSLCSVDQELTLDELEDLLPSGNIDEAKNIKADKEDADSLEALEGLDALANVAIQEDGDAYASSSLHTTTKHPRHRPGCSCIVCIQPPSGKGHKHKQTCTCNLCMTVKRRFKTLMLRREIKQSEKAETARQKLQQPEKSGDEDIQMFCDAGNSSSSHNLVIGEGSNIDQSKKKLSNQLDLNIQPEREEDMSPVLNSGSITRMLQDGTEGLLKLKKISRSGGNSTVSQPSPAKVGVENCSNDVRNGSSH